MTPARTTPIRALFAFGALAWALAATAVPARAANWSITLDTPDQTVAPGATAVYSGTITNGVGANIEFECGLDFITTPDADQFTIDFAAPFLALDLVVPTGGYAGPIFEVTWNADATAGSYGAGSVLLQTSSGASPGVMTAPFTLAAPGYGPFCALGTGVTGAGANAVASDDSSATPAIVWNDPGAGTLSYATWDGAAWSTTPIASGIGNDAAPSIAMDGDVRPHVVFYDAVAGDLVHAWDPGTGWQTEPVESSGNVGGDPAFVIDALGELHVSYYDVALGDLRYAKRSGGSWTSVLVDANGDVGRYSSITADEFGHPFISYYDATNQDLKFARLVGGVWTPEVVDATGSRGAYSSIRVFANSDFSIAYRDATPGSEALWFASGGPGAWATELVDGSGNPGAGASLAIDDFGHPRIAYQSTSTGELRFAVKNGMSWSVQPIVTDATDLLSLGRSVNDEPIMSYVGAGNGELTLVSLTTCGALAVGEATERPRLTLYPNHPNPFSRRTTFTFTLPAAGEVTVRVFDLAGRRVADPFRGALTAGRHSVTWNGTGRNGDLLAPGRYLYEVRGAGDSRTGRFVILR